ncbi:MAG: pilus assembly protein TadG-related protein [Actinomycetota bacterium]|nr:pilus assembly protein TadG-related protein [Actinomycetota bacterium]
MLRRRAPGERGAVAVIFAFLVVVLFGIAALAVDLGNTVARDTVTQTQADYAALAAANELTATPTAGDPPSTAAVQVVADYLNANQPQDDDRACWRTSPPSCVTTAQLTDGGLDNGEVRHTATGLQVVAPRTKVDFHFAQIFGMDGTYVAADATVNVFSGGQRVMPMFAVAGCDYGRQTLADPAKGHVTPVVPTLAYGSGPFNTTDLEPVTLTDSSNASVTELAVASTSNMLTLPASKYSSTRSIGFFRGDDPDPALVVTQDHFWLQGDATRTDLSPDSAPTQYTSNPSKTVQAMIPDAVTQTEGVWWVRVRNGTGSTATWSDPADAQPIRVGGAVLECAGGSTEGNFGTLKLPRTDVTTALEVPVNIAVGLQKPLTLDWHKWARENPTLAGECTEGLNGARVSSGTSLQPRTNCVDTDPGLPANVATQGLITGAGSHAGVLTTQSTRTGCDPVGGSSNRAVVLNNKSYSINDDVLTCYLTNGTTSLATIADPAYQGPAVLDEDIFSSPRFLWVPVLAKQPGSGGSATYSILDFRPAFITDEQALSTSVKGSHSGTADNGLSIPGNDVTQITIVFFDVQALPSEGDFPVIDYLGAGDPVIRLVD